MKKYVLICLFATSSLFASAYEKPGVQKQFLINGSIKGLKSGKVKLLNYDDRTSKTIDSGIITNGTFKLKGNIESPQMMTVVLEPGNWNFSVFVENSPVTVTADTTGAYYDRSDKWATIKNFTETGSKNYDDWMKYQNDPGQKQFDLALEELDQKFKAANNNVDAEYKIRDQIDSVRKLQHYWQKNKIDEYVTQNPSSVAGVYMFNNLYMFANRNISYGALDSMMNKFTGQAKASPYYASLSKSRRMLAAVQVGQTAPDFTLLKRDSTKLTLSSTRGKYLLIDFWASWCHPCREAIPHWKEIYKKYHGKGFDILSVSDDYRKKDWIKAMDLEKMPWQHVVDDFSVKNMPAKVGHMYMVSTIPFYALLDKQGKILVFSGEEAKIDAKLKEIFGE